MAPQSYKRGLLLQWHLTDRCNLRCSHCYQESYCGAQLPLVELKGILAQYHELLSRWGHERGTPGVRGHVTVTGGEPFVRRDFLDFCEVLASHTKLHSFAILTNGTLIDDSVARRLRTLAPSFVQVSIEGTRETHDGIRGKGSYDRTVEAIRHLVGHRIRVFISFTAHGGNLEEFEEVARLGRKLKVARVWADRLIPSGSGACLSAGSVSPEQTRRIFEVMERARDESERDRSSSTEVSLHRALQFLVGGGKPYRCSAGDSLLTVLPDGELLPCRRMPLGVGNLLEHSMTELYYWSELLQSLRDRDRIARGCQGCFYSKLCGGGLRCLSQAVTGSPHNADPGCWRAEPWRLQAEGRRQLCVVS